jgi:hypothetical protein
LIRLRSVNTSAVRSGIQQTVPYVSRRSHKHVCPLVEPEVHKGGPIRAAGYHVNVCGLHIAMVRSGCLCREDEDTSNFINVGAADVLVGGERGVSRRWYTTAHGGMVVEGCWSVQLHAASFDAIAAAIDRLAATPFGQTEEGRRIIERLRQQHAAGKIRIVNEPPEKHDASADFDPDTDVITIYTLDPQVEDMSAHLAHEGSHALNERRRREGYVHRGRMGDEMDAWDNGTRVYEEQKAQGSWPKHDHDAEDYGKAKTREEKEAFLRKSYGDEYF